MLSIPAARNWLVHQMDVHNTFLHGDLMKEVYMRPPPGFQTSFPGPVCRLQKSLHELRQAPRCCFSKLSQPCVSVISLNPMLSIPYLHILSIKGNKMNDSIPSNTTTAL